MEKEMTLVKLAEDLVAYGRKQGADQVRVRIGEGCEFSVDVLQGRIEKLVEAGSRGISIKVIKDLRVANASSSDFTQETLHHLISNAVKRAALSNPDEFSALPENEEISVNADDLEIYDPSVLTMTPEEKIQRARKTESICLADPQVKNSFGANFNTHMGATYLANSNGFFGWYRRSSFTSGIYLQSGEGNNLFDEGKFAFSRSLKRLMSSEAIAREAIHRVTRLIGAKKIETQALPIVFEPNMTGGLMRFFYQCINGSSIYRRQSFLADKLGEFIGNEKVTIIDDALIPGAPGTRPFDAEGVPARTNIVMKNGVLQQYLTDTYAARKLGMKSTGNGSGPTNFYLEKGTQSPEAIIQSVDRGLLLTGAMGQGTNPSTGDISRGAFGMMIEKGEVTFPVAEITISGNLGDVLKNIDLVGDDLTFHRGTVGPTVKVAEMTIGGK